MNLVKPPKFDTCNFYVEAISPAFDPKRVLHRRLFYIDEDRTKYVSVGFYPTRNYQPFVEFGAVKWNGSNFIILNEQHADSMAECLPRMCESMCINEQAGCKIGNFRLNKTGNYRVARLYLNTQYIRLTLANLQYLSRMFHVILKQLCEYINS